MSEVESQSAHLTPPTGGNYDDDDSIMSFTATTSAASIDLSAATALHRRFVDVKADGDKIYFSFTASAVTIVKTAEGTTVATADGTTVPWFLSNGEVECAGVLDPLRHRYLNVLADSTSSKLRLRTSSRKHASNLK